MPTLNDAMRAATGGGNVNDGLRAYYLANGATGEGTLNDLERKFLLSKGAFTGDNNDLWVQYTDFLGYTGTLNEKQWKYWVIVAGVGVPTNTVAPVVTGVPQSSNKLTCDPGTWLNADTISFQWLRNNVPMIGETGSQLTIISPYIGDVMKCRVTGANIIGSTSVDSNEVTIIP